MYIHKHMHTYMHTHMCTYMHTFMYMYMYSLYLRRRLDPRYPTLRVNRSSCLGSLSDSNLHKPRDADRINYVKIK